MRASVLQSTKELPAAPPEALARETGVFRADAFQQTLYLERKRRERSRRPLLLLLIDVARIPGRDRDRAARTIFRQLAALTRETDVKGWYREGRSIGVIFNECNAFDDEQMLGKVREGLERTLPARLAELLDLTLHGFAAPADEGPRDAAADPVLYPEVARKYHHRGAFFLKRAMDIAGSAVGLVLFAPFFLIIPPLIKLSSAGPVLFRQQRVGLYGKTFTFLKFRTMYADNDPRVHEEYVRSLIAGRAASCASAEGGSKKPLYKLQNDGRITAVGRILRKSSLDELPQFLNVLRGEMSLVGPRPPIPYEVERYDIWHRTRIVEVKPGITGLWQVAGRSTTTFDEMVRLDIQYVREWSLWLDLAILARTPWAVLRGKGAC